MARGQLARLARPSTARVSPPRLRRERGAALLVVLAVLGLIVVGYLVSTATGVETEAEKQRRTADALAQAKAALIAFALSRNLAAGAGAGCLASGDDPRPGDLPCPDSDNDGTTTVAATGNPETCGGAGVNARLGRLPWRSLGLPDLRDGDGERLWYAVSERFKNSPRTACLNPEDAGCLNSDTPGTITVRDALGAVAANDVVAVIVAPGAILRRQGAGSDQDRSGAGLGTPANYLDVALGFDNAAFSDPGGAFINGPVLDAGGQVIVNDRVLAITWGEILPALERRVAREVRACLARYMGKPPYPPQPQNRGRLPWAADVVATGADGTATYSDAANTRAGRLPDAFPNTYTGSGDVMQQTWPAGCTLLCGTWWRNWKQHVFYAVGAAHEPVSPLVDPALCSGGTCLSVQAGACGAPTGVAADAAAVVIVAGRPIGAQSRTAAALRQNPDNYVEGENVWGAGAPCVPALFARQPASGAFNDVLELQAP